MSDIKIKDFTPDKFPIEVSEHEYVLELSNEAVKKADEMGFIGKASKNEMGLEETLTNLIFIFGMKNHSISPNLAKKIAKAIIEEREYDPADVVSILIEELVIRYQQVFTVSESETKKRLTKI